MSAETVIKAAQSLSRSVSRLKFAEPVACVYNPLAYAWAPHEQYLKRFANGKKTAVFLGMNPGPFGMMQTGVPFGEVAIVRDWMGINEPVKTPRSQHPKRLISGFDCTRSEVSGKRLWSLAADLFGDAESFFEQAFVINYCPLVFLEQSGRNLTPDKLPAAEFAPLQKACDKHLQTVIRALDPDWAIGVGAFAAKRLSKVLGLPVQKTPEAAVKDSAWGRLRVGQILHPSPASPLANRGWAPQAQRSLDELGVFAGQS